MAPSDSAKVALGVLALAGIGVTLYLLTKHIRRKKKVHEKQHEFSPAAQKQHSSASSSGHGIQERKDEEETVSSISSSSKPAAEGITESQIRTESFAPSETAPISASMSGWEEVKPLSESFTEVKSLSDSFAEIQGTTGEMGTSQTGQESLGSFIDLSTSKTSVSQEATQEMSAEKLGAGDVQSSGSMKELAQSGPTDSKTETSQGLSGSNVVKEKPAADDSQSLKSEDTSSGEAPSFEHINGSDDATSLTGSDGVEGAESRLDIRLFPPNTQQQMGGSLQSFEQVSMDSSSLKTGVQGESLPSFEQISESERALLSNPLDSSSIVVIPEPAQSTEMTEGEKMQQVQTEEEKLESGQTEELKPKTEQEPSTIREEPPSEEEKTESSPEEAELQTEGTKSEAEETQSQVADSSSTSEGNESNVQSFEMVQKKGLGGSSQEYYSSESLQSFATATSGSSRQDFYSPISSPPTVDSSFENTPFQSFDDSTSYDTEASEELTFHDLEASGRKTPQSPQDRTPTNTPVPKEFGGGDAESVKTPVGGATHTIEDTLIADGTKKQKQGDEALKPEPGPLTESQPKADQVKQTEESAATNTSVREDSPAKSPLSIDKDKITEAILQAQNHPDNMEIGHLQILVELLKQEDWTLLNTTLQCLIKVTAFTINVNILAVCEGPKELTQLLRKFASLLEKGWKPAGKSLIGGAPRVESLFHNILSVINNLAMDIKSQSQMEDSIPALTDLLMTEGISETVTLASLRPLTNMASTKTYHGHYTRLLQQLYSFLDTSQSPMLRLQCLKLLVNLSLNADMVPHMLAAKAPSCLLDLLDINYDVDLLLRTVTFLANVMTIMQERDLSPSNLPPDEKAPSPETLLSALISHENRDTLRNKVYRLTRHDSEDVCYQASRLYKFVSSSK